MRSQIAELESRKNLNHRGTTGTTHRRRGLAGCEKSNFPRRSLAAAAKAASGNKPLIAAVNRCATQNQRQHRVFPQPVKSCPSPKTGCRLFPQPPKGASDFAELAASLKRCPDTKPQFFCDLPALSPACRVFFLLTYVDSTIAGSNWRVPLLSMS